MQILISRNNFLKLATLWLNEARALRKKGKEGKASYIIGLLLQIMQGKQILPTEIESSTEEISKLYGKVVLFSPGELLVLENATIVSLV